MAMKLAPTTTACAALLPVPRSAPWAPPAAELLGALPSALLVAPPDAAWAATMMASQSLHERSVNTPGRSAPGAPSRRGVPPVQTSTASGVMAGAPASSRRREVASRLVTSASSSSMACFS